MAIKTWQSEHGKGGDTDVISMPRLLPARVLQQAVVAELVGAHQRRQQHAGGWLGRQQSSRQGAPLGKQVPAPSPATFLYFHSPLRARTEPARGSARALWTCVRGRTGENREEGGERHTHRQTGRGRGRGV